MLRVSNLFYPRALGRSRLIVHQVLLSTATPSTTTSVLIKKLPSSVTNESLSKLLAELNCRKVLLEPGCAVHLPCEVEAEEAAKVIVNRLQCQTNIITTTIPSLFLQNIPEGISIQQIKDCFQSTGIKLLNIKGGDVFQIKFTTATDALIASNLIKQSSTLFQTNIARVSETNYLLNIHYWNTNTNTTTATDATTTTTSIQSTIQSALQSKFPNAIVNIIAGKSPSVLLRVDSSIDTNKAKEIIEKVTLSSGLKLQIDNISNITKPALLLRSIKNIKQDVFTVLSKGNGPLRNITRIQFISKLKDVTPDFAVAYFNSVSAAYVALEELKHMNIEGEKISVAFKSVAEPAIRISGLPAHATEETVATLFKSSITPVSIQLWTTTETQTQSAETNKITSSTTTPTATKITKTARVVLPGFEDVKMMIEALDCRYINKDGKPLTLMTSKERELEEFSANKEEESVSYLQHHITTDIAPMGTTTATTTTSKVEKEQGGRCVSSRRAKRGGQWKETLTVSEDHIYDTGFEISVVSPTSSSTSLSTEDIAQIQTALQEANIPTKSIEPNSGRSVFLAYDTLEKASSAQNIFHKGKLSTSHVLLQPATLGGCVTARLSVIPSSTIEVIGLSPELPASTISTLLLEGEGQDSVGGLALHPLRIDRSALLKFKRHREVVPGLNKLKQIRIADEDGNLHRLEYSKYRPLTPEGTSEYDTKTELDRFDGDALRLLLKDYMDTDPASRYQIAKNAFERALTDAKAFDDVSSLLNESTLPSARTEARECLRLVKVDPKAHPEATSRLFELFLQRDDFCAFSRDFRAMEAEFGEAEEGDPLNWSQFKFEIPPEVEELVERLQAADKEALDGIGSGIKFKQWKKSSQEIKEEKKMKETLEQSRLDTMKAKHVLETGEEPTKDEEASFLSKFSTIPAGPEGEEEEVKEGEEPGESRKTELIDSDGRAWAGTILYSDNVQKTMPGNRVRTKRVLVCIGNLRGAAGFGKGKGKTAALALNSAFRDALRNLTFIDLYDNYGLYHDVHGKHNSCHAYIQATPKGRPMVGSPFSKAILYNFGISTASIKLMGRRDPYAMCRSIFNALEKHENIDEFAKARGLRYLSLKWNHDNGV